MTPSPSTPASAVARLRKLYNSAGSPAVDTDDEGRPGRDLQTVMDAVPALLDVAEAAVELKRIGYEGWQDLDAALARLSESVPHRGEGPGGTK